MATNLNYGIATVDATGYDYSVSDSQTVSGLYAQIDRAYKMNMPILLYGWDYNDTPLSPMYVYVMPTTISTNEYYVIDGKLKVSSDDAVTPLS